MSALRNCASCVYSDWNYPSTECRSCRGFGNHATVLPTITNKYLLDTVDWSFWEECEPAISEETELKERVEQAMALCIELTDKVMFGDGEQCTEASRLLAKISQAMQLNFYDKER
jgi:hypothetical protein